MMRDEQRERLEDEYGMPAERLLYHLYIERGLSASEIATELDVKHRNTVKYWLRQCGIKLRSRSISDVQRVLMMAYLDAGLGNGSIAARVGCSKMTVSRYRNELETTREPIDLSELELSASDFDVLDGIIEDTFSPPDHAGGTGSEGKQSS